MENGFLKYVEVIGSNRKILEKISGNARKISGKLGNLSGGAFGKNSGNTQKIEKDFELNRQGLHNPLL